MKGDISQLNSVIDFTTNGTGTDSIGILMAKLRLSRFINGCAAYQFFGWLKLTPKKLIQFKKTTVRLCNRKKELSSVA